jgi:hypothetical protein
VLRMVASFCETSDLVSMLTQRTHSIAYRRKMHLNVQKPLPAVTSVVADAVAVASGIDEGDLSAMLLLHVVCIYVMIVNPATASREVAMDPKHSSIPTVRQQLVSVNVDGQNIPHLPPRIKVSAGWTFPSRSLT